MASKNEKFSIYALKDPRNASVRYIGYAKSPSGRFIKHLSEARGCSHTHKANWIRSLLRQGVKPELTVLESGLSDPAKAERRWIAKFKAAGADLTNATSGGDGLFNPSASVRGTLSQKTKNRWRDPKFRRSTVRKIRAVWKEQEHRERNAAMMRALADDPSERKHRSEEAKRRWADPDFKTRVSATLRRSKKDPEFRRKMSENAKKRWQDPEFKVRVAEKIRQVMLAKVGTPEYEERCRVHALKMQKKMGAPKMRKHLSEMTSKYFQGHPERRAAIGEQFRLAWKDPEWRESLCEKLKAAKKGGSHGSH